MGLYPKQSPCSLLGIQEGQDWPQHLVTRIETTPPSHQWLSYCDQAPPDQSWDNEPWDHTSETLSVWLLNNYAHLPTHKFFLCVSLKLTSVRGRWPESLPRPSWWLCLCHVINLLSLPCTTTHLSLSLSIFCVLGRVARPDLWNSWSWASGLELQLRKSEDPSL
jgi:hypothetical protein